MNYEEAVSVDPTIRNAIDLELETVKKAVRELHDDSSPTFSFHSKSTRLVGSATENWQKAFSVHRIWSMGQVTYNANACTLSADVIITMEDFYNFNKGQVYIATGLPDDANGRFEVFGWAKSFFSRGFVSCKFSFGLSCCRDLDCGDAAMFDCKCNRCETQCPSSFESGGQGFTEYIVDLKKKQGIFAASYQMYPTRIISPYFTKVRRSFTVKYGSNTSTSTSVLVQVNAPNPGTAWDASIYCGTAKQNVFDSDEEIVCTGSSVWKRTLDSTLITYKRNHDSGVIDSTTVLLNAQDAVAGRRAQLSNYGNAQ